MDISARKSQAMEIEKLAYYDPLTRLPNRRMLMDRTAAALVCARSRGSVGALLYIDLDNLKNLNYSRGRPVEEGLRDVALWNAAALATPDLGEAVRARLGKTEARFPPLDD